MKRREFLEHGAKTSAAAAVAASACAHLDPSIPDAVLADVDMGEFMKRMDVVLNEISLDRRFGVESGNRRDVVSRQALRALHVMGTFRDLSSNARRHPLMQKRLQDAFPEMDEAVFGMAEELAAVEPAELERARRALRDHPEIEDEIVSQLLVGSVAPQSRQDELRARVHEVCRWLTRRPSGLLEDSIRRVRHMAPARWTRESTPAEWNAFLQEEVTEEPPPVPDGTKPKTAAERMRELNALGLFYQAIADTLSQEGYRLSNGKRWKPAQVEQVLTDSERSELVRTSEALPSSRANLTVSGDGSRALRAGAWLIGVGLIGGAVGVGVGAAFDSCGFACLSAGLGALLMLTGIVVFVTGILIQQNYDKRHPSQ